MSKNNNNQLTPVQAKAVSMLVDVEAGYTYQEIAEACGISVKTLYNWRHYNKAFIAAMKEQSVNSVLINNMPAIMNAIVKSAVEDRNASAQKLAMSMLGLAVHDMRIQTSTEIVTDEQTAEMNAKTIESIKERLARMKADEY